MRRWSGSCRSRSDSRQLQPTAAREAALAFLIYNRSRYAELLVPTLTGADIGAEAVARHRASVATAIGLLEAALQRGDSLGRFGTEELRREDALQNSRELAQRAPVSGRPHTANNIGLP